MAAYDEALGLLFRGLDLLADLPETLERDRRELDLRLAAVFALTSREWGSPEQIRMIERARTLCEQINETERWLGTLYWLCSIRQACGEFRQVLELSEQMLEGARKASNPTYSALAYAFLAVGCLFLGNYTAGCEHAERSRSYYDSVQLHASIWCEVGAVTAAVAHVQALEALALWALGYPDRAVLCAGQAADVAVQTNYSPGLGLVMLDQLGFYYVCHDWQALSQALGTAEELAQGKGAPIFHTWVQILQGWKEIDAGDPETGISRMRRAMAGWQAAGNIIGLPFMHILLAKACLQAGRAADGLEEVEKALALVEKTRSPYWFPEIYCLRGELLLAHKHDTAQAEADFLLAVEMARRHQAKSWELRATTSLARLWQRQGKADEAHEKLSAIYDSFTQGFETKDLQDACRLLAEL